MTCLQHQTNIAAIHLTPRRPDYRPFQGPQLEVYGSRDSLEAFHDAYTRRQQVGKVNALLLGLSL